MDIILDSNIITADFLMRYDRFEILFDYVRRTQSKLILTRIVIDELKANYERELSKRIAAFSKAQGVLRSALLNPYEAAPHIDAQAETERYLAWAKQRLGVVDAEIVDYRPGYLEDVIHRAIQRIRPCSDKGEEIRDAVLWNMVLDQAEARLDKQITFVSANTAQFAAPNTQELHPQLQDELAARGLTVQYYTSLEAFAKEHATRIDFITTEWLAEHLDLDMVLDRAFEQIERFVEYRLERRLDHGEFYTGELRISGGGLELGEHFVYAMSDESLKVEAITSGTLALRCEVHEHERYSDYNYDPLVEDFYPTPRSFGARVKEREVSVWLRVTITLTIRERGLISWEIANVLVEENK